MSPKSRPINKLIIQFAKHPTPGKVKTRLIPLLGEKGACELHEQLVEITWQQCQQATQQIGCDLQFWTNQEIDNETSGYFVQQGNDLGERMSHAINQGLHFYDQVLLVGSDCPVFTVDTFRQAFSALDESDRVLVPSNDGGYVLVGARRSDRQTLMSFGQVNWGTESVLEQTQLHFKQQELTCKLLEPLFDIDDAEDYQHWQSILASK